MLLFRNNLTTKVVELHWN